MRRSLGKNIYDLVYIDSFDLGYERMLVAAAGTLEATGFADGDSVTITGFTDPEILRELSGQADDLGLDVLMVDAWAYVNDGNSNDADDVTPQLMAFSGLRDPCPGLTTGLIHHARKDPGQNSANRLTGSRVGGSPDCSPDSYHLPHWGQCSCC